ncbi:MAG: phosphatase PAP2 family protein [Bacilli bacterium]
MKKRIFSIKNIKWCILFILAVIVLFFTIKVFNEEDMKSDIIGYNFVSYFISDNVTVFMKIVTWFGGGVCLIILTILSWIFIKNKKIDIAITSNLVIITILNTLFKYILQRPRPEGHQIIVQNGYSFPSGHSMIGMAFYGYLIYLVYKYIKNKKIKVLITILLSIIIITIGISRIYLGVHYTSDVLCGFMTSICYLIIYITITDRYLNKT